MRVVGFVVVGAVALGASALRAQDGGVGGAVDAQAVVRTLAQDATDLVCLFGVPTDAQREAATRATGPVLDAAAPRDGDGAVAHARALLVAATLLDAGGEREALIVRAAGVCGPASPGTPDGQVERFVLLALCEVLAGDADGASAGRAFDHLVDAKSVMRANRAALPGAASLQVQVTCATVLAALIERGPEAALRTVDRVRSDAPFTVDGRPDALGQLLLADLRARAHARDGSWGGVCAVYESLAGERDWGLALDARRALALGKTAALVPDGAALESLPPFGVLAESEDRERGQAVVALRGALVRGGVWRDEVALALGRLLAEGGPAERCEAARVLIEMVDRSPSHARAGEAIALACASGAACGDDELFVRALSLAHASAADVPGRGLLRVRFAQELGALGRFEEAGAVLDSVGGSVDPGEVARVRARLALARYRATGRAGDAEAVVAQCEALRGGAGAGAPAWSDVALAEGYLALDRAGDAVDASERAVRSLGADAGDAGAALRVEAMGLLVRGLVGVGRYAEAGAELSRLAQLDAQGRGAGVAAVLERGAWGEVEGHVGVFASERAGALGSERGVVERLGVVLGWAEAHGGEALAGGVAYRLAYAELLSGDAAAAVERMRGARSVAGLVLLGESQLASGDDAGAFATLSRLAQSLSAEDEAQAGAYWQAWTRVLGVLDRQNGDGSRSATIRRRLVMLGPVDEGACAECVERIAALRTEYLDVE